MPIQAAGFLQEASGSATTTGLDIDSMLITPVSMTSVEITISKAKMTKEPTEYKVDYYKMVNGLAVGETLHYNYSVTSTTDNVITIDSLLAGTTYRFYVTAYKNLDYGKAISDIITLGSATVNGKVIGGGALPDKISSSKSFLTITAPSGKDDKNKYAVVTREFSAINPSQADSSNITSGYWYIDEALKNYETKYYSFGTSLFLDNNLESPKQGAGIGFFTNSEGTKGYFILIESTALSASQDRKSIRVVKADGTKLFKIADSQSKDSTYEGVFGGKQYNIDIKVKISQSRIDMVFYINGYKITAVDEFGYDDVKGSNYILSPTNNVTLICTNGTVYFDYVYGTDIDESKYTDMSYNPNFYQGQFSNDLLDVNFGDLVYKANYTEDEISAVKGTAIDEFGTTAREITKASVRFSSRPSFPLKWSTGTNNLAKIIGSKVSSFGGEAYVLNNSSVTIPLSDSNTTSFYVYGNELAPSGDLEYSTDEADTYSVKEPVRFESRWIQTLDDAKSLGDWIKTNVVNKGKVVNMTIFANPAISIGDIISINYPYQGFDGTEKFIVTSVTNTFNEGLETRISCRLIAS